jgi:uncharacterized protein (TIGR02145 family)
MKHIVLFIFIIFSSGLLAQLKGEFIDPRDLKVYKTVQIGSQTWMAENLNVDKFRNGDPIPEAKTEKEWIAAAQKKQPAWCYYDNDSEKGQEHGKLYNWYAVSDERGLAPYGWHIPSDIEWEFLLKNLGGDSSNNYKNIPLKLKAENKWGTKLKGNNQSGFSALPSGFRRGLFCGKKVRGTFTEIGTHTYFWSSSFETHQKGRYLKLFIGFASSEDDIITLSFPLDPGSGLSVRCVKD